ncbi:unnamed protein product [Urochloa humidicola]
MSPSRRPSSSTPPSADGSSPAAEDCGGRLASALPWRPSSPLRSPPPLTPPRRDQLAPHEPAEHIPMAAGSAGARRDAVARGSHPDPEVLLPARREVAVAWFRWGRAAGKRAARVRGDCGTVVEIPSLLHNVGSTPSFLLWPRGRAPREEARRREQKE